MSYSNEVFLKAQDRLKIRREEAEDKAEKHRDEFASVCPEFAAEEQKMQRSAMDVLKVINFGDGAKEYIEELRNQNLSAQKKIKLLLKEHGYPENYLEPDYFCKKCNDTGFSDGKICPCLLNEMKKLSFEELCEKSSLKITSFDDFDLSYYEDNLKTYKKMQMIFNFCKTYANTFTTENISLLFSGGTGLGKTHLSLAIAGEVAKKGYNVVYGSAHKLFSKIEAEKFGRSQDSNYGETEDMAESCDLLIIDDLGSEFTSKFSAAALYDIINERLLRGLPTIISTNLESGEIEERYSQRVASRLYCDYKLLEFEGTDVRMLKKARKNLNKG